MSGPALLVAGLVSALAGVGGTIAAATKGGAPDFPAVKPPAPPPKPPPPPEPPPPAPTAADAETAVTDERRKRQQRFGIAQTLLTSPLGGSGSGPGRAPSLLGG